MNRAAVFSNGLNIGDLKAELVTSRLNWPVQCRV